MTKFNAPPKGGGGPGSTLSRKFAEGLLTCFERTGQKAIDDLANDNPTQYLRFVAGLSPDQEAASPLMEIQDDELAAILDIIRQSLRDREAAGDGTETPPREEPAGALPALREAEAVP
jgi:hypothetical protein